MGSEPGELAGPVPWVCAFSAGPGEDVLLTPGAFQTVRGWSGVADSPSAMQSHRGRINFPKDG